MISIGAIAVFGDELYEISSLHSYSEPVSAYGVAFFILLRIDAGACRSIGGHGLIAIFSEVEDIPLFVEMHTLDDFRSHQGAFCDDAFK